MTWNILAVGPWHKSYGCFPWRTVMRATGEEIAVHRQIEDAEGSYAHGDYFPCTADGIREALAAFEARQ